MRKKVFIMNGPPGSGKDTIADLIVTRMGADHFRFKTKLYEITALINNLDLETFIRQATDRDLKDSLLVTRGLTPRELLIETSEEVIKPHYGEDYFGIVVGDSIQRSPNNIFAVSDSGFVDELLALKKGANIDGRDIVVIRIHRNGYTFDNDSRDYISDAVLDDNNINKIDLCNDMTLDELSSYIDALLLFYSLT